jgi:glycosyltransferase involved in cell wall biosynthesis
LVGLNLLDQFVKLGHEVALFPLGGGVQAPEFFRNHIEHSLQNSNVFDTIAPSLRLWHQFDLAHHVGSGLRAGFTIFELDTLTPRERHYIDINDVVIVPSRWAKQVLLSNNLDRAADFYVAPLGVDRNIFHEHVMPVDYDAKDATIFINVGKWEVRKGHDILVEAFNSAFNKNDNVQLWMMCINPFIGERGNNEWAELYKTSPLGDKIMLIDRVQTHQEVARIMAKADCGVFPSRAEGWNLELLEMMSMGKPVITTNYSGHTEYANKENSYLIDLPNREIAFDGQFFSGQGSWGMIESQQMEELIHHMRSIHQQKQSGGFIPSNDSGIETAKQFSWERTVNSVLEALKNE